MQDTELIQDAVRRINNHFNKTHTFEIIPEGSKYEVKIDGKSMVVQDSIELLIAYLDGFETALGL